MAVKLQVNVPETFELQYPDGLRVSSRFGGDQVMFTLTNGEKWYTDPFIASKIRDAGIGAYQPFTVTKREVMHGNRRKVEYEVEAILEETRAAAEARPTTRAAESHDGKTTAVFLGAGASVTPQTPAASSVALMKMAGIGAIDAVLEIESYARSRGLTDFTLGVDNIQRIASSLFIEMTKRGGRA